MYLHFSNISNRIIVQQHTLILIKLHFQSNILACVFFFIKLFPLLKTLMYIFFYKNNLLIIPGHDNHIFFYVTFGLT